MAAAPAAAAAAAAAAPPPGDDAVSERVLVDEYARAYYIRNGGRSSSRSSGRSSRAAALDAATLAALAALEPWSLLLIVGPTSSGKSLALQQLRKRFGLLPSLAQDLQFDRNRATVSNSGFSCPPTAVKRLSQCGLNSPPTWMQPFHTLSNGQQQRVRLALSLRNGATVEDLGTGVESRVSCSVASSAGRFVRTEGLQHVVITTSNPELIRWLGPDIVLFMPSCRLCVNPFTASQRRPLVALRYDSTQHDSGALPPGVECAVRSAQPRIELTCNVAQDAYTAYASRVFDLPFNGLCTVRLSAGPAVPSADTWSIGLLYGPSGCGKSTHLATIAAGWVAAAPPGQQRAVSIAPLATAPQWSPNKCMLSVLGAALGELPNGTATEEERNARQAVANERYTSVAALLRAVGLRKAAWLLPFSSLSSGERELAALAYALSPAMQPAPPGSELPLTLVVVDELTSALDCCAAHAAAVGVAAFVRARPRLRLLAAGVRDDLLVSLRPSWAYAVKSGRMEPLADAAAAAAVPPAPALPPPPPAADDVVAVKAMFTPPTVSVVVRSLPAGINRNGRELETSGAGALWEHVFRHLHYLDGEIGTNPTSYIARLDDGDGGLHGEPIGFVAVAPSPGRKLASDPRPRNRESRMVIVEQYQGLGIGPRMSPAVALHVCQHGNGGVLVDSTAHAEAAAAGAGDGVCRYMVQTSMESLAASRDRDHHNWKRQEPYTVLSKRSGLGFHSADAIDDRQERLTFHHEFVGLKNRDKPLSKQPSVMSFFGKAAAPAAKASGASGSGAGGLGAAGILPDQSSKWQPAQPLLMLAPHAAMPARDEARTAAGAAAGATPRGQARAADAASGEAAPKAVRRIR